MSDTLTTLPLADVVGARVESDAPRYGRTAGGYGRKVPTSYVLTLTDGRERRVYASILGNGASLYVVRGGQDVYLSSDVESILELMRDGVGTYSDARESLSRTFAAAGLTFGEA